MLLAVGFGFHFPGQAISLWNWPLTERLVLQDKGVSPAQKDYERDVTTASIAPSKNALGPRAERENRNTRQPALFEKLLMDVV